MQAAVCLVYGPPEVVRVEEQRSPTVAPGQVRVKVSAAAVNFPDVLLIANEYQISVPTPFVPGSEFAGVIVETSDGAEGFAVGDRVTGAGLSGAFAEEVAVPAGELSHIPDGVDDQTAAAFGVAYRTAYHMLRSMARLQAGDELVVLGDPVLIKGAHVLGFQFQDVPPDEFVRNEDELCEHLVSGRVLPHVCAVYPLAETVAALKHVADGRAIGRVIIDLT